MESFSSVQTVWSVYEDLSFTKSKVISIFFFCCIFLGTSVYFCPFYILTALLWILWNLFCVDFLGHRIKNQPKAQQQAPLKETVSLGWRQTVSNSDRQWLESWVGNEGLEFLQKDGGWGLHVLFTLLLCLVTLGSGRIIFYGNTFISCSFLRECGRGKY